MHKFILNLFFIFILISSCQKKTTDLSETETSTSPIEQKATALFEEARLLQKNSDLTAAISIYEQLIMLQPSGDNTVKTADIMNEGLLQLMYCYIFSGRRQDGADYYNKIYADNKLWLVQHYPRNVEVCLAYSLYETSKLDDAVAMIDKALARSEERRNPEQLYVDYGIAGAIYNQTGNVRKAIACSERCVEVIRTLPEQGGLFYALSNLIYQYQQVGEFEKSLAIYEELIETDDVKSNPYHLAVAETNVIQLFDEWGMEDEVQLHFAIAEKAAIESKEPEALLRVMNLKTSMLLENARTSEASLLLDSIATLLPVEDQSNYYRLFYNYYRIIWTMQADEANDRSVSLQGRRLLTGLKSKPLDNLTSLICRLLGKAFFDRKEYVSAIEAYQYCSEYAQSNQLLNQQRIIYSALSDIYSKIGKPTEALSYFHLYDKANKAFTERRNAGLMSQFRVKYETREKEQANKLLQADVQIKKRTIQNYTFIGMVLTLLVFVLITWLIRRNRRAHELVEVQEQILHQMLNDRLEMNRKNEELRIEIERANAHNNLEELINSLAPRLLTTDEEQEFRQQFSLVYPSFLIRLRQLCPAITPAEELLSMLIRLNMNNNEIALALGNNLSSVHTSRSRFRKKLNFGKDESLEEFIRNI